MLPETQKSALARVEPIYRLYASLLRTEPLDAEHGLGGKLLFAGQIGSAEQNSPGRQLLFAANIAGSASLAASADPAVQRQAIRDGVVDFMVTSLEEALRILKNEVRKRQAVSVGVAADPQRVAEAMLKRGVLPNLLPPSQWDSADSGLTEAQAQQFVHQGAQPIRLLDHDSSDFVTWSPSHDFARWLPKLDACAQAAIPTDDFVRQRWLRLAPRYLGRMASRQHCIALTSTEVEVLKKKGRELLAQQCPGICQPIVIEINSEPLSIQ